MVPPILTLTDAGLYVPAADLHIDPWKGVDRAVVTHGHADHARRGSRHYLAAATGLGILRKRLGPDASLQGISFGESVRMGDARISLHPAGHILGSAQVRVEVGGEVWVVTGDYKRHRDPTAEPFEPVPCHTLISECTFGLPVYRWPDPGDVLDEVVSWWRESATRGRTALLLAYALGKAQRLLAGIGARVPPDEAPGPLLVHGAVEELLPPYREAGIPLPDVTRVTAESARRGRGRALVLAPPSTLGTPWVRKLGPISTAFASGWMRIRGMRRRRAGDRGFVLSDHVDWEGLLATVRESGAERVGLTHGTAGPAVRYLREAGWDAFDLPTRFRGGGEDPAEEGPAEERPA